MKQVKIRLDGYTVVGIMGHEEPFRTVRTYMVNLTEENLQELNDYGSTTIFDIPWRGAWIDIEGTSSDDVFYGECYSRDDD